jgi:hypothetical protein
MFSTVLTLARDLIHSFFDLLIYAERHIETTTAEPISSCSVAVDSSMSVDEHLRALLLAIISNVCCVVLAASAVGSEIIRPSHNLLFMDIS